MIGTYKVVDIHPRDNFYSQRDKIIGLTLKLEVDDGELIKGWSCTNSFRTTKNDNDFDGVCFVAVKLIPA